MTCTDPEPYTFAVATEFEPCTFAVATEFDKVVNAVCAPDGRAATTKEDCERAAKSLYPGGFRGVHVSSGAETPFGCGYSGADVHFNTKSDSTATSYPTNWGADRGSICRAVTPACSGSSSSKSTTGATLTIIVPVVVAAVLLVAAVLYLVRKRRVAALQLHRQSSMPTIGGDDEAEVEA